MHRIASLSATALAVLATRPAHAHFTSGVAAHWHASDAVGLLAVVALTGAAAWLGRRGR